MRKGDILHVWKDGVHVGLFTVLKRGVGFEYDAGAPRISYSMPREGGWTKDAPENFLENLLPETGAGRYAMMQAVGAKSQEPFDLLDGTDTTGGLVFTRDDRLPDPQAATVVDATDDLIATRIAAVRHSPESWFFHSGNVRYSLAGMQGKFTLTRFGDGWIWPNGGIPSTHILKPATLPDGDAVENATMRLSALSGIETPSTETRRFNDQSTYIVERFDRRIERGMPVRLPMEDMTQALGLPPSAKYEVSAVDLLATLNHMDPSGVMGMEWLRRLAFNTAVANCDAHARNYSVMPVASDGESWRLAPMYDALTTTIWSGLNDRLAMPFSGAEHPGQVTPDHYARLADYCGLDPDTARENARRIHDAVLSRASEAYEGLDEGLRSRLTDALSKANRGMTRRRNIIDPHAGMVHVVAHDRDGHSVRDYWRRRPSR